MAWVAVGAAVVGAVVGGVGAKGQQQIVRRENKAADNIADSKNYARMMGNYGTAAAGNLSRWTQSLNNQRHLKNAGSGLEALQVNYQRTKASAMRGTLAQQLQGDERAGQIVASSAAAGVRGSVVDAVNATTELRQSMASESAREASDQQEFDFVKNAEGVYGQMIGGLDGRILLDNLDYRKDVSLHKAKPSSFMGMLQGAMQGYQIGKGIQGAFGSETTTVGDVNRNAAPEAAAPNQTPKFRFNYGHQVDGTAIGEGNATGDMWGGWMGGTSLNTSPSYGFSTGRSTINL